MRQTGVALPVEIDHAHGGCEERFKPGDIIADVVHQLA